MNVIVNLNDCEVIRLLEVLQFILEILNTRHGITVGNTLDWLKKKDSFRHKENIW